MATSRSVICRLRIDRMGHCRTGDVTVRGTEDALGLVSLFYTRRDVSALADAAPDVWAAKIEEPPPSVTDYEVERSRAVAPLPRPPSPNRNPIRVPVSRRGIRARA